MPRGLLQSMTACSIKAVPPLEESVLLLWILSLVVCGLCACTHNTSVVTINEQTAVYVHTGTKNQNSFL